MKACVLEKAGKFTIKEVSVPEPKPDEVLVRVKACGLCGTDVKLYKGEYTARVPVILGHEFSGEIEKAGSAVKGLKKGDRVVIDPNESCGSCNWCRSGHPTFCNDIAGYGVLRNGGFAEYCAVVEKSAYKLPEKLDYEIAVLTEPVSCTVRAIDRAGIKPGETVLIMGGGPSGQMLVQLVKNSGASKIIVATRSDWKLKLAKRLGATYTINAVREDMEERVAELTDGSGPDVVIEAVGNVRLLEQAAGIAKRGGRVIIFGLVAEKERVSFIPFQILSKELSIFGSWVNPHTFERAISLMSAGVIDLKSLISEKITLSDIKRGFGLMKDKPEGFMKAVIIP